VHIRAIQLAVAEVLFYDAPTQLAGLATSECELWDVVSVRSVELNITKLPLKRHLQRDFHDRVSAFLASVDHQWNPRELDALLSIIIF